MSQTCINIACGDTYIEGWLNLDYTPHSPSVTRTNLLTRLPFGDANADVVYSSHFFEHIPRGLVNHFASECFRILKPGARLRLVLPDLEEMCRSYLVSRGAGEHAKADFLVLEMLDQCVRMTPGGELGAFYEQLQYFPARNVEMIEFVRQRTGHQLNPTSDTATGRWKRLLTNPVQLLGKLEKLYCEFVLAMLPSAFRHQNVSLAEVGERHAWIYDFFSVSELLAQAGFVEIKRVTATTSDISNFPFFPLDVTSEGQPRKGLESMYIEALKP